jgi:TonB family protein
VDDSINGNDIIAVHEQVHANQLHSADVLIIEAVMIINWFNPVVYFYRYAIKHIHEFIADNYTLKHGTDKTDYAMLLLSQTFNAPQHQLVSNFFNKSLLKQRILMLQKDRSARIKLVKYGLSAPLFVLMMVLSSATVDNSKAVIKVTTIARNVLELPADRSAISKIEAIKLKELPTDSPARSEKAGVIVLPETKNNATDSADNSLTKTKITSVRILDTLKQGGSRLFNAVEIEPQFPGGSEAFMRFLGTNIHYPPVDKTNRIQGKVFVNFVVEKDGSLDNIKVLRTPTETLGAEVVRVMTLSPKWRPGIQNGYVVRTKYTVPVSFTLADDDGTAHNMNMLEKGQAAAATTLTNFKLADTTKVPQTVKIVYTGNTVPANSPLIVIDGKIKTYADMKQLDPATIKSINVYKGKNTPKIYGSSGENNGVVEITLKN